MKKQIFLPTEIGLQHLRDKLGDIVEGVARTHESVIITKNGRPRAKIVSFLDKNEETQ